MIICSCKNNNAIFTIEVREIIIKMVSYLVKVIGRQIYEVHRKNNILKQLSKHSDNNNTALLKFIYQHTIL